MQYQSTRDKNLKASSAQAILNGLAPDGGLYTMPSFDEVKFDYTTVLNMDTMSMSTKILSKLLPDFSEAEMAKLVHDGYTGKFETDHLTPTVPVGEDFILELFRGPTSAFKDVALSMLPRLMTASKEKLRCGRRDHDPDRHVRRHRQGGDGGLLRCAGHEDHCLLPPRRRERPCSRRRWRRQAGENVCVCAVRGNFDDAQTGVKKIFSAVSKDQLLEGKGVRLSSANSINIGRLAPQVVYYYRAYADLVQAGRIQPGDKVDYVVPTGNFGDILAGYFAKEMGLPVGKLVCASNANNVLTDFLRTGRYDRRRPFYKTVSPSMDILVSSNLERLLYLLSGDDKLIADLMKQLSENGEYEVPADMLEKLHELFWAGFCDDEGAKTAIGKVWKDDHYLCDTHTAVAWDVAQQYKQANHEHNAVVVLSTASPYKFPAAVLEGIGEKAEGDEFDVMEQLHKVTGVPVPKNLADLRSRAVRHRDVIDRGEMLDYVLGKAAAESDKGE